jgi:hypothetical protein
MTALDKIAADVIRQNAHLIKEKKFHELLTWWETSDEFDVDQAVEIVGKMCEYMHKAGIPFMHYLKFLPAESFFGADVSYINVPNNIDYVGYWAMSGCTATRIVFQGDLDRLEEGVMSYCENLKEVVFKGKVGCFHESCFEGSLRLQDIYYPGSIADFDGIVGVEALYKYLHYVSIHCKDGTINPEDRQK